jgi:hypothetical protein
VLGLLAIDELVLRATLDDETAWRDLWDHVEDVLAGYIGSPRYLGRLGQRVVDRQNIIREVMECLRADGMHRLRAYLELHRDQPRLDFECWLQVLARRVGNSYMRSARRPEAADAGHSSESMRRAAEIVSEPALSALELWTAGASYADIAHELELDDSGAAERVIRGALALLQRSIR